MNVLILGGTHFIGRHIAEASAAAGHAVTVFNRGQSPDELPAGIERLRGDRDGGTAGLNALGTRTWDACIDVSGYTAVHVRSSAERLASRVNRYVYISAVAVYGDPTDRPVRETHPRVQPAEELVTEVVGEMYARLKVTCENIVHQTFADRATILRPQVVIGPHDPSGRYTYWLQRAAQHAADPTRPMLAPGDGSDHLQMIDARDLARFATRVIEYDVPGIVNLAGPRFTWSTFMQRLGVTNPTWVSAATINAANVTEFELPLYRHERGPRSGLMDIDNSRAFAAGLTLTDPASTLRDTQAWMSGKVFEPALSPEREQELCILNERGRS